MDVSLSNSPAIQLVPGTAPLANRVSPEAARSHWRTTLLVLVGVWVISTVYVGANLNRGWVPHDEGTYAQSAERVLHGELPHRDFDDLYTGGLSFLNAFAFSVFGMNLFSLRLVLFVFFLAWVPAMFYIAKRFASDFAAGAITLLAVAWGIPNYSAAVPSWYNLSFALLGTAAILRYLQTRSSRWLFLAGLCAGLSILIKITGIYFSISALLFFVFREQCETSQDRTESRAGGRIYSLLLTFGLLSFIGFLSAVVRGLRGGAYLAHFVFPGAILVAFLLLREFQNHPGSGSGRFLFLLRMVAPFTAGIALPIVVFLIPYIWSSSLPALIRGVFVLPQLHLTHTVMAPPNFSALPPTLFLAAVIALGAYLRGTPQRVYGTIVAVVCVAALFVSRFDSFVYQYVWNSLSFSIPLTVLSGAVFLHQQRNPAEPSAQFREPFMLLVCVTAIWTLVQVPFSAPIYFCFVAPFLALTVFAFFSSIRMAPRFVLGTLLGFYLLFAVLRTTPAFIYRLGNSYVPDTQTTPLTLPRAAGLRIDARDAQLYERLIPLVQEHAIGEYAYAAPDCPEVYFLSGLRNPTRTLFDFFDDPENHTERILRAIEQNRVNVVAILQSPAFSVPLAPDLRAALTERFPNSNTVGRFEVRWRR